MRRALVSLVALLALTTAAAAQLCGPSNPNCIVPNRPPGTNDATAANTAFVAAAIIAGAPLTVGTTAVVNGVPGGLLYDGAGNILQNNGPLVSPISNPTANGQWSIGATSSLGAITIGQGSLCDATIENSAGAVVLCVPTGSTGVTLGTQQTTRGTLTLSNTAAGAFASTIQSSNSATAAATYTLPTAPPVSNGQTLTSTTAGVMSWTTATGSLPCTTTALSLQYNNAGAFGCVSKWTSDGNDILGTTSARQVWNSDTFQFRDAAVGTTAFANATTASGLRVYNTTDQNGTGTAPTNYERGVFDWTTTANVLTIGTQAGGTGTQRNMNLVVNNVIQINGNSALFADNTNLSFFAGTFVYGGLTSVSPGGFKVAADKQYLFSNTAGNTFATADTGVARAASKVVGLSDGQGANANSWLNWAGEARLDADFSATSNTTLANVTGSSHSLTVSLLAGRKYIFHVPLFFVTGATLGGIKAAFGGTATVTNFIADGVCVDGTTEIAVTQISALATAFVANTNAGTTPKCIVEGTFEVLAAGTFTVQFAQNVSNGTASTVKRGSYMLVEDAP